MPNFRSMAALLLLATETSVSAFCQSPRPTTYQRIETYLASIPAIDTHDHLQPFDELPGYVETSRGRGMNLFGLWRLSYFSSTNRLTPWKPGDSFDAWWSEARNDFSNARATSFYRYMLPAFQDLYGIDFDHITNEQARGLDDRIFENYRDQRWLYHVITERANIELMFNDPYWARLDFRTAYPFGILVFNVANLIRGFHPSEFKTPLDSPYEFARKRGLRVDSLDDYLALLDVMFREAKQRGAISLKMAPVNGYERTYQFDNVPNERAAGAFGKSRSALTAQEAKDFEDFIMWRLVELSAKYDLPMQVHTGDLPTRGCNPMFLINIIAANPHTKFILFHGGFPWVGETGAIAMAYSSHVWVDSVWLPTLSYATAKRTYAEWLDEIPSNHIMWGADGNSAEAIYGATVYLRRCLAEVLADKVDHGGLSEDLAKNIGKQILRDNALELFPELKKRLWKDKGRMIPPPAAPR
jgi:uncharacterized protein